MSDCLFSVIVPVYNKADTLQRAIDSVLHQTCDDFELLIVNDGSQDNSEEIVKGCKDARLRYFYQENEGVSSARNHGIEEASGRLITFLDADDEWMGNHLQVLKRVYQASGELDAFYSTQCKILLFNQQCTYVTSLIEQSFLATGQWAIYPDFFMIINRFIRGYTPFNTNSVMISKKVLKRVGNFRQDCKMGEDIDLWYRVMLAYPAVIINEETTIYHREASTATSDIEYNLDWPFLSEIDMLLEKEAVAEEKRDNVEVFCDRVRIRNARHLLLRAHKIDAVQELSKIKHPCRQKKELLLTVLLIPLPASFIRKSFYMMHQNYYQR